MANNQVRFRVGLPVDWNQDFYFQGLGGLAGHLGTLDAGLARGYASASTDTGHQGSTLYPSPELDGGWALNNRPKQIDYGYRGVHVATIAAKAIVDAYYGRAPRFSILSGCSNGGRQGLIEAQRFPGDYDGVIASSPVIDAVGTFISWIWQMQTQLGSGGAAWVPPTKLPLIDAASLQKNDGKDDLVDGLIDDPRRARFNPMKLVSEGDDEAGSLTRAQAKAVRAIYKGPPSQLRGIGVDGHPVGHEEVWERYITGTLAPVTRSDGTVAFPGPWLGAPAAHDFTLEFLRYFVYADPTYELGSFDLEADLPTLDAALRPILNADDTDVRAFQDRGGKLLVAHGWVDPAVNPMTTVDYYSQVTDILGIQQTRDFFRLFMAPGMSHCSGGPGPNRVYTLTAMEQWLRDGVAPDRLVASHPATGRTRPLCPYPAVARYIEIGSIDEAGNFRCEMKSHRRK